MTFLDLVRKSAWRKPLRTILLMVSVATAFLIYGLTTSFIDGSQGSSAASEDILGVMSAAGRAQPLPMSYLNRIAAEPGVAAVGYMSRLRGFTTVEKNIIAVSAADPARLYSSNGKELGLTPSLISALSRDRSTVLVGQALAEAQGWTVGQKITVTSFDTAKQDGSRDWSFEIAGIFNGENASTDTYFVIAQYDYVNALRARNKDTVDAFIIRPQPDVQTRELASKIDQLFANSAAPTQTRSEKQFLEAFLRQYADIGLIVNMVVGAAFVALLMIVGNTMVFAVRERTFEIGVLKTLGFSGSWIMALILGETLFIFLVGGTIGLMLALLATVITGPAIGLVFSKAILARALAMVTLLALATGALPALNALRIPIISAFRTR
ncbi:putative ABC transport system permease protein [Rhizobium sp. ERR 922]|uniref:ABC transporter permease n=1 Tax=unclassified Rhizobium TaxID=2613769 RepID=UPI0011A33D24|nr:MULTISPECIES: ABC transporter permease [unclassified Rhizobium]TWB53563.1 putative ABC transport system permease protein [Rhizobium sp. ERR 922]TWB95473.1 putative ABC transport system permease protein [Rhizobium sp. ERR 942]